MNKDTNQIMALLKAYRMDGLGNNFIIIDRRIEHLELSKDKIVKLSASKLIPFDQLITLEKKDGDTYPIKIFNPDGGEVSACGNGSRCVAYLLSQEINQHKILIKTKERILNAEIIGKQNVSINMGNAKFKWDEIPLSKKSDTGKINIDFLGNEYGYGFCVNVGNPHIIFFVEDCFKIKLKDLGPKIENYNLFPDRTNVTFGQVIDKKNIKVNVWERGAGQTKACGTAACATAIAASERGLTDKNINIIFSSGSLEINCGKEIFMAGSVSEIKKVNLDI
tara:strand:- start:123 stop:959 length:837 start_codon:yes stop_codon:yes gene_type:complete